MTRHLQHRDRPAKKSSRLTTPVPDTRRRMLGLLIGFVLVGVALVGVLADLQTVRPDRYRNLGEDQRTRTRELAGFRGSLVDRHGFVLAASTPGKELVADPTLVRDPVAAAAAIAPILRVDPDELARRLVPDHDNDRYELLVQTSDEDLIQHLGEIKSADSAMGANGVLQGVFLQAEEARVYPAGDLARSVVGGVDAWEQGIFGLEAQFNEVMQGSPGTETSERGLFGSIAGGFWEVEPASKGYDLVLTLDHRIQYVTELALIEHCEDLSANSAQAVVSDPRTGEILAMANVVRQSNGACVVPKYNAPLVETFEPGSVLKVLTAAAAVEELGLTGDTLVDVPNSVEVGDFTFNEHLGHVAAAYPLSQVIADSMNVGTIKLALAVGPETLRDYYGRFGFAQYTGLDWAGEARGTVADAWYSSELGSVALGLGVTVNTVQIMSAYNALANDGMYVAPRLVRAALGTDGLEYDLEPQQANRVVSANTANEVTEMLVDVVEVGTGTEASVDGYRVAGKTGTAWKVFADENGDLSYGSDGNRRYVLSFAGFLPAEDPQISIVVSVDEPRVAGSAGLVAAPVFADIAQYALRILAVPPAGSTAVSAESVRAAPAPDPSVAPLESDSSGSETALESVGDSG